MSTHESRTPVPAAARPGQTAVADVARLDAAVPAGLTPLAGLTVGHADDPAEGAADQLADVALARLRSSVPPVSDGSEGKGEDAERHSHDPGCGHLRRSVETSSSGGASASAAPTIGLEGGVLDGASTAGIEAARSGGAPLPGEVRRRMETGFGQGLGHVRVHDGPQAAQLSASMGAEAFTTGSDIFFGAGRFAPQTDQGERVLAHEIAHVVGDQGPVRRFWGKKTPAEKAAKEAKKKEEADKAAKVKESKKTEKAELAGLKESRKTGVAGRAALQEAMYDESGDAPVAVGGKVDEKGHVTMEASGPQKRANSMHEEFEAALHREKEVFEELVKANKGGTDEKRAAIAYKQVWYDEYAHLNAVRPPRETAAERLVSQVRGARTGAGVDESAQESEKAALKTAMLPKAVQGVYDQMVTERDAVMLKQRKKGAAPSEAIAQDEARAKVLKTVQDPKVLGAMPPQDGALDVAAWKQAEARVAARDAQKKRDVEGIEASLALMPAGSQSGDVKPQAGGTAGKLGEGAEKGGGYLDKGSMVANYGGGGIAGKIGKGQDAELLKSANATRAASGQEALVKEKDLGAGIPVVGDLVTSGDRANKQLASGQREWKTQTLPESDATKAKSGIGSVTGILGGLMTAATSAFQMVSSTQKAWESKDPYEGLKAAKAGATGLDGLVTAAKSSADLAKLIDASVSSGVAQVIPGLDIAASALSMVRGVTDVATSGMRQRETDLSMFEARAGSTDKVNVMVYPLMKVSQQYTKGLEESCWNLSVSILNFSTAVAQVASAGGFGIPAAIKAATAVIDKLHSLAHYIADKVLAAMAKRAEKESAVQHLEGGAEDELRRHPKMAVDGIILKAAAGDKTALMFLANYRIDGKPITQAYVQRIKPKPVKPFKPAQKGVAPEKEDEQTSDDALLTKIRTVVLAGMGTGADPQSVYEDLKSKANPVLSKLTGMRDAWKETGELAEDRNKLAGEGKLGDNKTVDRGLGWRIKQMLSPSNRGTLKEKTAAYKAAETLPKDVACAVGEKAVLMVGSTPPQITAFVASLTVEALEAELKRSPRRNSPEWIAFLREALVEKIKAQAASAATANAGKP